MVPERPAHYPVDFFRIAQNDLDRIARRITHTGLAQDLTALGRQVVRDRLRYGAARTAPPTPSESPSPALVRIWDPADAWHSGDYTITAVRAFREHGWTFAPTLGEIIRIQGNSATVRIDGDGAVRVLGLVGRAQPDPSLAAWRASVEAAVAALGQRDDNASRIDYLLWTQGEEVWSGLLRALRQDARFVALNGAWFLRSLIEMPSRRALEHLARIMLQRSDGPWGVKALLPWCGAAGALSSARLFGLALALQERPDLFQNVDVRSNPRWALAGPPPGPHIARYAAYDPESYELLCEPGDVLSEEVVARLWALDLLATVV